MTEMKSHVKFALLFGLAAAIPIEAVNFWVFPFPIDVGLPDDATLLQKTIGAQWLILHWPGMYLADWFEPVGSPGYTGFVVFFGGYLSTALLIIAGIFCFQWFRHLAGKYAARQS
jgi:hypothetical protein